MYPVSKLWKLCPQIPFVFPQFWLLVLVWWMWPNKYPKPQPKLWLWSNRQWLYNYIYFIQTFMHIYISYPPKGNFTRHTEIQTTNGTGNGWYQQWHNQTFQHSTIEYYMVIISSIFSYFYTNLRKISPGNDIYIISRFVHSPVLFLIINPTRPPKNTPVTVSMVREFSWTKCWNLENFVFLLGRIIVLVL